MIYILDLNQAPYFASNHMYPPGTISAVFFPQKLCIVILTTINFLVTIHNLFKVKVYNSSTWHSLKQCSYPQTVVFSLFLIWGPVWN